MNIEQAHELSGLFDIYDIDGYTRTRLGVCMGGGYVVPAELLPLVRSCVTYGVGPDTSFETHLDTMFPENNIAFDFYDHTVPGLPGRSPRNSRFYRRRVSGLAAGSDSVSPDETLFGKKNVLLKFDIEGAEYELTDSISDSFFDDILFVVFELHWLHRDLDRAANLLRFLGRSFVTFHLHSCNNEQRCVDIGDKKVPDVCEFTMINRAFVHGMSKSTLAFPVYGLDFKNTPWKPDLVLNWTQPGHKVGQDGAAIVETVDEDAKTRCDSNGNV